ncbi:hypothetical protein Tco_0403380, partial [Tanacetum coccineum]
MMDNGTPCRKTISFIYNLVRVSILSIALMGMKCADLVRRSTMTQIVSCLLDVLGSFVTKSIVILSHFHVGIFGCIKPGWMEYFDLWDSCMIKSLKPPKNGNQLWFLIHRVLSGRTSNALSIPHRFSALMFPSLMPRFRLRGFVMIVPAFMKELIYKVLGLLVPILALNRFEILLGEPEEGQVASSGWPFVSAVPGQMTHLVASLTLDSARSCVMHGAFLTQGKASSIPTVFSWGDSISADGGEGVRITKVVMRWFRLGCKVTSSLQGGGEVLRCLILGLKGGDKVLGKMVMVVLSK